MSTEVEIPTGLAIDSDTPAERTTPRGMRLALAGLLAQASPGVPVGGRLRAPSDGGGEPLQVAGTGAMQYTVNAGVVAIPRTGQGVYLVANPTEATIDTDPADGANPRIDRIYIAQPDPELTDDGVARVGVVVGTPGASPALPDLPDGAYELARKVIAAGATTTAAGAAFTNVAPFAVANAEVADASVTTAKIADAAVTNAKIASGISAAKITTGTIPDTVTSNANHTGKIQGRTYYIQQADPGSVADGSLWDSW